MTSRLVLATRNPAKLAELRRILEAGQVPVGVGDLGEYPGMPEVAETGRTFEENALLKARGVAGCAELTRIQREALGW